MSEQQWQLINSGEINEEWYAHGQHFVAKHASYHERKTALGRATIAIRPRQRTEHVYGDDPILVVLQAVIWRPDGSVITTHKEFFGAEGAHTSTFAQADQWVAAVENGQIKPVATVRYIHVAPQVGAYCILNYTTGVAFAEQREEASIGPTPNYQGRYAVLSEPVAHRPGYWYVEVERHKLKVWLKADEDFYTDYYIVEVERDNRQAARYERAGMALESLRSYMPPDEERATIRIASLEELRHILPQYRIIPEIH